MSPRAHILSPLSSILLALSIKLTLLAVIEWLLQYLAQHVPYFLSRRKKSVFQHQTKILGFRLGSVTSILGPNTASRRMGCWEILHVASCTIELLGGFDGCQYLAQESRVYFPAHAATASPSGSFPGDSDGKGSACSVWDLSLITGLGTSREGNDYAPWSQKELVMTEWVTFSLFLSILSTVLAYRTAHRGWLLLLLLTTLLHIVMNELLRMILVRVTRECNDLNVTPQFMYWNPNALCSDVGRLGLWEVLTPHEWDYCLIKEALVRLLDYFYHLRTLREKPAVNQEEDPRRKAAVLTPWSWPFPPPELWNKFLFL